MLMVLCETFSLRIVRCVADYNEEILALIDSKLRETNRMNKCAASGIYRSTLVEIKQMIEDSKTWD